jgi:hypothetical protein
LKQDVDEDDEKALQMFMSEKAPTRRTLADIIMEKITEKQTEIKTEMSGKDFLVCVIVDFANNFIIFFWQTTPAYK